MQEAPGQFATARVATCEYSCCSELERVIKTGKEENGPGVKHSGQIR
jgi:hypothetical protein